MSINKECGIGEAGNVAGFEHLVTLQRLINDGGYWEGGFKVGDGGGKLAIVVSEISFQGVLKEPCKIIAGRPLEATKRVFERIFVARGVVLGGVEPVRCIK